VKTWWSSSGSADCVSGTNAGPGGRKHPSFCVCSEGTILSAAMMLRYSLDRPEQAARVENAGTVSDFRKKSVKVRKLWEEL